MTKPIVYLDWNCINGIKTDSSDLFRILKSWIKNNRSNILLPYSPSHLVDLNKNYKVNKALIDRDLLYLSELTDNLIIAKYFNQDELCLEHRNAVDFFREIEDDRQTDQFIESIADELSKTFGTEIDKLFQTIGFNLEDLKSEDDSSSSTDVQKIMKQQFEGFAKTEKFSA